MQIVENLSRRDIHVHAHIAIECCAPICVELSMHKCARDVLILSPKPNMQSLSDKPPVAAAQTDHPLPLPPENAIFPDAKPCTSPFCICTSMRLSHDPEKIVTPGTDFDEKITEQSEANGTNRARKSEGPQSDIPHVPANGCTETSVAETKFPPVDLLEGFAGAAHCTWTAPLYGLKAVQSCDYIYNWSLHTREGRRAWRHCIRVRKPLCVIMAINCTEWCTWNVS